MPRKRKYDKNFNTTGGPINVDAAVRRQWESQAADKVVDILHPIDHAITRVPRDTTDPTFAHVFMWLLNEIAADSYLRIVPSFDASGTHWYIKYTRGQWAGYYLYFWQRPEDAPQLAAGVLMRRYHEVLSLLRKPTKDSAYGRE